MKVRLVLISLFCLITVSGFADRSAKDLLIANIQAGKKCDDQAVFKAAKKVPNIDPDIASQILINGCGEFFKSMLPSVKSIKEHHGFSPKELDYWKTVAKLVQQNFDHFASQTEGALDQGNESLTSSQIYKIGFSTGALKGLGIVGCRGNHDKYMCEMVKKSESDGDEVTKLAQRQGKQEAGAVFDKVCPTYFDMLATQKELDNEKEVGDTSGFVDAEKMHEMGIAIVGYKKQLAPYETDYKEKTGQDFNFSWCPQKYNRW